jgi:hypothetical protein
MMSRLEFTDPDADFFSDKPFYMDRMFGSFVEFTF